MWIRVPGWAVTGRVLLSERGRRSVGRRVTVERGVGAAAAFAGDGMWIWQLSKAEGGDLGAIAARAKASGIETVHVKAGDGTNLWNAFSPSVVATLKAAGLRVCAWQYVYGSDPQGEAAVAAAAIGKDFPIALSSFPYVDYHSSFPYSVFLGPGGAQANLPQMYWKAIGTTPDQVFARTYAMNQPYGRPILPLGQLYEGPAGTDVARCLLYSSPSP